MSVTRETCRQRPQIAGSVGLGDGSGETNAGPPHRGQAATWWWPSMVGAIAFAVVGVATLVGAAAS